MTNTWTPDSWRRKPLSQGVEYADRGELRRTRDELERLPPLVAVAEVEELKRRLAEAQLGRRFLLQGGDCCERFDDCRPEPIAGKLRILLKMGAIIAAAGTRRVIHVGRIAGQFAKPRSADLEVRDGVALPSYRGDLVNRPAFTAEDREPDPRLLLEGYRCAGETLRLIRNALNEDAAKPPSAEKKHPTQTRAASLQTKDVFASHEGLHLDYEQALTRRGASGASYFDLSTHFPWIGHRTNSIDGAHVEFFRGLSNPIGLKVGPTMTPQELTALIDVLNPDNEPGRLTLIHRFGVGRIEERLPPLIEAARRRKTPVLWSCDPMHGNTRLTQRGVKTRDLTHVLGELRRAFEIHGREGSLLGGVHVELSGENVTECIGGTGGPSEADLGKAYLSDVDPRLNYDQALEMAESIARWLENTAP
ncbi:MAG: 3-deoxy-7-phosphoheptulonate synthase [Pirellulales bacterium]|nr:3-deoxy-7-phosphoheptulonate synthase [Pirellulales bacterium]